MGYETKLYWDGEIPRIQTKDKLTAWLASNYKSDTWFKVTIEPLGEGSDQQRLYFAWRDILADYFGWSDTEMHEYLKKEYNGGRSTKGMGTKEWSKYMTQILAFAGEHDITLPTGKSD